MSFGNRKSACHRFELRFATLSITLLSLCDISPNRGISCLRRSYILRCPKGGTGERIPTGILYTSAKREVGAWFESSRGSQKIPSLRTWNFLSKPQAWYIITARSAVYITNNGRAVVVSHHAPACIFLWLDDIQHFVLMIYNASH